MFVNLYSHPGIVTKSARLLCLRFQSQTSMVIYPLGILFHRLDQILLLLFNISLYRCHFNLIRKRNRFIGFSLPIYNATVLQTKGLFSRDVTTLGNCKSFGCFNNSIPSNQINPFSFAFDWSGCAYHNEIDSFGKAMGYILIHGSYGTNSITCNMVQIPGTFIHRSAKGNSQLS